MSTFLPPLFDATADGVRTEQLSGPQSVGAFALLLDADRLHGGPAAPDGARPEQPSGPPCVDAFALLLDADRVQAVADGLKSERGETRTPATEIENVTVVSDGDSPPRGSGGIGDWCGNEPATLYEHSWEPEGFSGSGDPCGLAPFHRAQAADDTCAVVAQVSVLESVTGEYVSESDAVARAEDLGLYAPGEGTTASQIGKLLESYGVDVERREQCDLVGLAEALERGDRVIVAVNADEISRPMRDQNGDVVPQYQSGGHAVWVTGLDVQDGKLTVILNDPGTPEGAMKAVSIDDFTHAWAMYDNLAIIAPAREA